MTPSVALVWLGAIAGCAAAFVVVGRYFGASDALSALAQSGSVRLRALERGGQGSGLSAATADAAHIELLRQLLEEARAGKFPWRPSWGGRGALAVTSLAAVAMICLSLLTLTDNAAPTAPSSLAVSDPAQDPDLARLELYARSKAPRLRTTAPMSTPRDLPDVETMMERLAARLQTSPEDADGWRMLGWSYFNVQQASKAVDAYARASAIRPQSPELKSAYGEALVAAEAGKVTPKAIEIFNAALALDAGDAKARYFLALAMDQAGKKKEALDVWLLLQAEPLGDEPWVAELHKRTQALADELKGGVSVGVPPPAATLAAADAPKSGDPRQLSAAEIQSVQALPVDEQQALIRAMVNGLADRLQEAPRDEEGWLRLIRSRVVLGEQKAAREALTRALAAFSDDAPAGARIAAAARQLGVESN